MIVKVPMIDLRDDVKNGKHGGNGVLLNVTSIAQREDTAILQ